MTTLETSSDLKDIAAALLIFQGKVHGVLREAKNPAFRSRYATLEGVIDTVRPGLQEAGIVFTQAPGGISEGKLSLTTTLIHAASGQFIRSTMQAPLPKSDPQAVGSVTTYLSRYSLMAILGVPPTDDDAEAAMPDRAGDRTVSQRAADSARPNGTQRANGNSGIAVTSGNRAHRTVSQQIADKMCAALWRAKGQDEVEGITEDERFQRDLKVLDREDLQRVQALIDERKMIAPDGSTVHEEREGARH